MCAFADRTCEDATLLTLDGRSLFSFFKVSHTRHVLDEAKGEGSICAAKAERVRDGDVNFRISG